MPHSHNSVKSRRRILVVEDDAIVAWDIALQIEALGHEHVGTAISGKEAVDLAGRLRPDLVLMDVNLKGDMNGIAAAHAIRTLYDLPHIYLSAFSDSSITAAARSTKDLLIKVHDTRS